MEDSLRRSFDDEPLAARENPKTGSLREVPLAEELLRVVGQIVFDRYR
jgi:hypothetical protein